jgi:hypothetical protein
MEFFKMGKFDVIKHETANDVYFDMMHSIIEEKTGLYTSL